MGKDKTFQFATKYEEAHRQAELSFYIRIFHISPSLVEKFIHTTASFLAWCNTPFVEHFSNKKHFLIQ